jgi:ornithine cyclodeaminase/alanine dehydrogenase-like protein (mu-crystallin family)
VPEAAFPPLRYLSAADVAAAMPPIDERLRLARVTLEALVADAELPAKIGVHPRPAASFAHAMPALLRGRPADGTADLMGMKWVVGFPANAGRSLPAIHATILLTDALTGVPRAIIDGAGVTAQRTAAVSGVAIAAWSPVATGRPVRIAMVGAGAQALAHLPVLAHLLPGAELHVHDRDAARAATLVREARSMALAGATVEADAVTAIEGSDVVVTLVSFGPERQAIPPSAFRPGALVVAVDYDMCVPAAVARDAALFLADETGQLIANRATGIFAGYPDPGAIIGAALLDGRPRPDGIVLVTHLGVGLADVVFGDAILRAAEAAGLGTVLPR